MKKPKARAASETNRLRSNVTAKKSVPRSARGRSLVREARAAKTKANNDALAQALTALVEISVEIRELLTQIRNALVEGEETEPERVETVIIAEAEGPETSEDDL